MLFQIAGVILFALFTGVLHAGSIQVLELNHKTASELIPLIKPMLSEGDAITGTGYQLILRTDKATLTQIKSLLQQIDTRPRNLLISVRNNTQQSGRDRELGASGSVVIGDHDRTDIRVYGTDRRNTRDSDVLQKITVLEGERAMVGSGQSVPFRTRQVYRNGRWVTVHENVQFEDVGNSVYVVPSLQGDRVRLSIEPVYSNIEDGSGNIHYQAVNTIVTGRLGEWISLGGIDENIQSRDSGIVSTYRRRKDSYANIEVKVEIKE